MSVYLIIFSSLVIIQSPLFGQNLYKKRLKFIFIFLLLFSSIRDFVGRDVLAYYDVYNTAHMLDSFWNLEIYKSVLMDKVTGTGANDLYYEKGFVLITKLFPYFQLFLIFISSFYLYTSYKLIKLYIKPEFYYLALFFTLFTFSSFLMSWTALRQFLAVSIALFSLKYVINKNPIAFIICIFIAYNIHRSSIIISLMYLINFLPTKYVNNRKLLFLSFIAISILLPYVIYPLITSLLSLSPIFSNLYVVFSQFETEIGSIQLFYTVFLLFNVYEIIMNINSKTRNVQILYFNGLLYLLLSFLALYINAFSRLNFYFVVFYILSITNIFSNTSKLHKFLILAITCSYTIKSFIGFFQVEWVQEGFVPYRILFLQ